MNKDGSSGYDNSLGAPVSRRAFARGAGRLAFGLAGAGAFGGLTGFAGGAQAAAFKGARPFKIGFVAPLTGPVAPEGIAMQRGFELGLEELNAAGGIAGQPIEVVRQDDQAVPAVAGTVLKKFIQEDGVDMVVGTITSDEETVASQICAAYNVPVMFLEAGFWMPFCKSTCVLLGETSYSLLGPLVPFMAEKFGKKFLLIGSDFEFPHQYLNVGKSFIAKAGGSVVDEFYAPLGTADWSSSIAKIKSAAPDVILSAVVGGDAIAFVKQAKSFGLLPGAHLTGITLQPEFYPPMGDAVDGLYTVSRYSEEIKTAGNAAFIAAYKKKYGEGPIPLVGVTAYYSLRFVKAAVEKAGTYDRKAVFEALKGVAATTPLSDQPLTLNPSNLSVDYPMYVCQIQRGGLFKIVKDLGVVSAGLKTC
ncbi:MAG: ABC transporter substrate-binding protein [Roseiarcus sp.]|jgi:ABC-type branched-subunit amino acid transport system substrate-binding protein